jgi:F-type H+-transporting ATPase subunit b
MDINATFIGQALAFAILIWFSYKFVWPPMMGAIEERQKKIAEGLEAADRSKKDLAQAEEKVNEVLREARAKANEIIDQAQVRANQIIDHAKDEAILEAGRQKTVALSEIESATNRAKEDLRRQVSQLAVAGAEKLIRKEIDGNVHKALLDELAAEI